MSRDLSLARLARRLIAHAARVMPRAGDDWIKAMRHELEHVPPDERLAWAVGCVIASYRRRSRVMNQRIAGLSRWVLGLELGVCFLWPTLLFAALLSMSASASPAYPSAAWLASMFAATVLGPLGLVVTLDALVRGRVAFGKLAFAALGASAAWGFVAFTLQAAADDWSRSAINGWVLLALLPAVGAAHLLYAARTSRHSNAA